MTEDSKQIVNWNSGSIDVKKFAFEITAGRTYVFFVSDCEGNLTFRTVTFEITEDTQLPEDKTIPEEIIKINWIGEKVVGNELTTIKLTENTVTIVGKHKLKVSGTIVSVKTTDNITVVTWVSDEKTHTLTYDAAKRTLIAVVDKDTYVFIEDIAERVDPAEYIGTWTSKNGDEMYKVVITADSITFYDNGTKLNVSNVNRTDTGIIFTAAKVLIGQSFATTYKIVFAKNSRTEAKLLQLSEDTDDYQVDTLFRQSDRADIDVAVANAWLSPKIVYTGINTFRVLYFKSSSGFENFRRNF